MTSETGRWPRRAVPPPQKARPEGEAVEGLVAGRRVQLGELDVGPPPLGLHLLQLGLAFTLARGLRVLLLGNKSFSFDRLW